MTPLRHRRQNATATTRNPKTLRVLELHHAGCTPREIGRIMPRVTRDQIYGILHYRDLTAHQEMRGHSNVPVWRDTARERETDALCESGEVDRRALAYRIVSLGGTTQMIAVELGCDVAEAERYAADCPPGWMTFRD